MLAPSVGMKNLLLTLIMLLMTHSLWATPCSSNLSVTNSNFDENMASLQAAVAAGMERQQLLDAEISYGSLGLGAGRSKLGLELVDGKIVNLVIETNVKMAGIDFGKMSNKINLNDFRNGRTLNFKMDGADHPALIITPGSGFTERGGRVSIKTWTGRLDSQRRPIYTEPTLLYIGANNQNRYSIYRAPSANSSLSLITQANNRVTGLRINMRGNPFNTKTLYAHSYRVRTQGDS